MLHGHACAAYVPGLNIHFSFGELTYSMETMSSIYGGSQSFELQNHEA
jgi:hypothetical protein